MTTNTQALKAAAEAATPDLHDRIMNISHGSLGGCSAAHATAYNIGHRDARHAAAELAAAYHSDLIAELEQLRAEKAVSAVKYGCHIDLPDGEYDDCVLDGGNREDCVYASAHGEEGRQKCGEWKPVKFAVPQAPQATLAGWKLVPTSLTREMYEATWEAKTYVAFDRMSDDYEAMIEAAPEIAP